MLLLDICNLLSHRSQRDCYRDLEDLTALGLYLAALSLYMSLENVTISSHPCDDLHEI